MLELPATSALRDTGVTLSATLVLRVNSVPATQHGEVVTVTHCIKAVYARSLNVQTATNAAETEFAHRQTCALATWGFLPGTVLMANAFLIIGVPNAIRAQTAAATAPVIWKTANAFASRLILLASSAKNARQAFTGLIAWPYRLCFPSFPTTA